MANIVHVSLVLKLRGRHSAELKAYMAAHFGDVYFDEHAIYMERNSRDFRRSIAVVNDITLAVCNFSTGVRSPSLFHPRTPPSRPSIILSMSPQL